MKNDDFDILIDNVKSEICAGYKNIEDINRVYKKILDLFKVLMDKIMLEDLYDLYRIKLLMDVSKDFYKSISKNIFNNNSEYYKICEFNKFLSLFTCFVDCFDEHTSDLINTLSLRLKDLYF